MQKERQKNRYTNKKSGLDNCPEARRHLGKKTNRKFDIVSYKTVELVKDAPAQFHAFRLCEWFEYIVRKRVKVFFDLFVLIWIEIVAFMADLSDGYLHKNV